MISSRKKLTNSKKNYPLKQRIYLFFLLFIFYVPIKDVIHIHYIEFKRTQDFPTDTITGFQRFPRPHV